MRRALAVALVLSSVLCLPREAAVQSGAPSVTKVDPPSWFVDHSTSTVQLLVRGSGMAGATLVSSSPFVAVERQQVNARGTYLIAYVRIADGAPTGEVALRVVAPAGDADVPFGLVEKLPAAGRFQGLTPDDVVYLLMPDRFADGDATNDDPPGSEGHTNRRDPSAYHGGDFAGIRERLPYLKGLGVTAIWLNPWYDNDDGGRDYHGYGAVDLYDTEEHFGTLAELRALVDAAHALGIKVVQDQVANHTGPKHPWVQDYPTPTWYNGTPQSHLTNDFDIPAVVDPGASPADRRQVLEGWFGGFLPDLNQRDPETARYLLQNSLWWIEQTGVDAVRQDTLPYVPRDYWAEWMSAIEAEHPNFFVVGEVFHTATSVTSFFQGGETRWDGIDSKITSVFDFPLWDRITTFAARTGQGDQVAGTLGLDPVYPDSRVLVPFIGNHDTARFLTVAGGDAKRLALAQTVLLTSRGIPQLYYGDEIAMAGGADPDNRRDFPGGFPGDKRDAFSEAGRKKKQRQVFDHVQLLLLLRRAHAALRGPQTDFLLAEGTSLAYVRSAGAEHVLVLANASPKKATFDLDVSAFYRDGTLLLDEAFICTGGDCDVAVEEVVGGRVRVTLKGLASAVLVPDRAAVRSGRSTRPSGR